MEHRQFLRLACSIILFCLTGCASVQVRPGGTPAADFSLPDLNGASHSLREFTGKPLLIHFWSPACSPCRPEMVALNELQKYFGDRVTVLAIASHPNGEDVKKFSEEIAPAFPILVDMDGRVTRLYGVSIIPVTFTVGSGGNLEAVPDPDGGPASSRFDGPRGWNSTRAVDALKWLLPGP